MLHNNNYIIIHNKIIQLVIIITSCFNAKQHIYKTLVRQKYFQDMEILQKPNWFDVPDIGTISFLHLLDLFSTQMILLKIVYGILLGFF